MPLIRVSLSSLSVSLIIYIEHFGCLETFLIRAKDFLRVEECNQHFVAPAPSNIPIEVVSVRVRERTHEERTPSGVVFWTERVKRESEWRNEKEAEVESSGTVQLSMRDRWRDEQTKLRLCSKFGVYRATRRRESELRLFDHVLVYSTPSQTGLFLRVKRPIRRNEIVHFVALKKLYRSA